MYCPKCLTEYRDSFFECADCHMPLAPGLPRQPSPEPQPVFEGPPLRPPNNGDLALVTVLETNDSFGLSLAKAALEDAGIEYLVAGGTSRYGGDNLRALGLDGGSLSWHPYRIQVTSECESEARELLEPFQKPLSAAEMEADPDPGRHAEE